MSKIIETKKKKKKSCNFGAIEKVPEIISHKTDLNFTILEVEKIYKTIFPVIYSNIQYISSFPYNKAYDINHTQSKTIERL